MAKRKAEEIVSTKSLNTKRRAASEQQRASIGLSAEQAFRQKHTEDFDLLPSDLAQVKKEPHDDDCPRTSSRSPEGNDNRQPATTRNDLNALAPKAFDHHIDRHVDANLSVPRSIPEDTLLEILCTSRDVEWVQIAIGSVLQHACTTATSGDEFGIAYIRAFISRLADRVVYDAWLAEVIGLIQQRLDSTCDRVQSQIHSLGKARASNSSAARATQQTRDEQSREQGSSKASASASQPKQKPYSGGATIHASKVTAMDHTINGEAQDSETDVAYEPSAPPISAKPAASEQQTSSFEVALTHWQLNTGATPLYAPRSPLRKVFDLFARCAIDAHHFHDAENVDAIQQYRKHARAIWKKISTKHRSDWEKLFEVRTSATNISLRGQALLKVQGLLADVLQDSESLDGPLPVIKTQAIAIPSRQTPAMESQAIASSSYQMSSLPAQKTVDFWPQEHSFGSAGMIIKNPVRIIIC